LSSPVCEALAFVSVRSERSSRGTFGKLLRIDPFRFGESLELSAREGNERNDRKVGMSCVVSHC
jgi:hypothetical protein